jgi:hypothetical protein
MWKYVVIIWIGLFVGLDAIAQNNEESFVSKLVGEWTWERTETVGRGDGSWVTAKSCECSKKLLITNDDQYQYFEDGELIYSGNFLLLVNATDVNDEIEYYFFNNKDFNGGVYFTKDGFLRFGSIGKCGVINVYKRVI